ncbi:hypothetical protein MHYP_G00207120 [Metynnis hypsauchen]
MMLGSSSVGLVFSSVIICVVSSVAYEGLFELRSGVKALVQLFVDSRCFSKAANCDTGLFSVRLSRDQLQHFSYQEMQLKNDHGDPPPSNWRNRRMEPLYLWRTGQDEDSGSETSDELGRN